MNQFVSVWGGESQDPPCFLSLWQKVTQREPDRVALVEGDLELTYADLAGWVAEVRDLLAREQVAEGQRVAVAGTRNASIVAAMLAVVSSGASYVPLDSSYPELRLRHMLEDSKVMLALHGAGTDPAILTGHPAEAIPARGPAGMTSEGRHYGRGGCDPDDAVYVIYTSGSTGRPNGLEMPHGVIDNMVWWQIHHSVASDLRTAQFAPLNFDVWFQEVLGTLCAGGTLILVPESCRSDPFSFLDLLLEHKVERLFLPYMAMQMLALAGGGFDGLSELALKEVNLAGEQLLCTPAIRSFFEAIPDCRLNNHYGQSESAMVSAHTLEGDPQAWPGLPPIGLPLPGCEVLVDFSVGEEERDGELLVCGSAVANGYLGRPELNARRYISVPATAHGHTRAFRTGDLARVSDDGVLEFLGRLDDEVKVRGYRVNPKEVEACLLSQPGVVEAVCVALTMEDRTRQLHAVIVARNEESSVDELRAALRTALPTYAVPLSLTVVEDVPRTPSGKIDRAQVAATIAERRLVRGTAEVRP